MSFNKVDPKQSFPKIEEEILKFWEDNKIFEKSVEKNSPGKSFIFYEGPPTANGTPGLHHVLARAFKDIIPRYKTMKGYRVERKAGWDTHGLPVELQVEKELGLKNKREIENIIPGNPRESIIEFNKKCKDSVWKYKDQWEKLTRRMAYWVDMKNPYVTYENKYIESVWWVIAQIFKTKNKKGESMVYKGHKVVPYCYRCGTTLSSHEVAQGYQKVKDNSVFVKFKAKTNPEKGIDDSTYFLVWTTTPWTLPGNVALAVNKDIEYVSIYIEFKENKKETYVIAKNRLAVIADILGFSDDADMPSWVKFKGGEISSFVTGKGIIIRNTGEYKGKDLLNFKFKYKSLYETNNTDKKAYYIVEGDFVTTQEGTGIVHIAPAFGADDSEVGKKYDLPTLVTVDIEGRMSADVPGKGILVKKKNEKNKYAVDELIIENLKNRPGGSLIFKEQEYPHEYPFCWRCDTPLIYYAKPSWFIRMSELSEELVKNNENINWIPEHIKQGRFGEWLKDVKDWAISRERYWGTPLPIWECEKCEETKAIESIKEMEELSGEKLEDIHKPYIDDVKIKCACGSEMQRVPEVLDVWFDSGSMPLAQFHYPSGATGEDKEKIESGKYFPADYISEAIDQTRGWFYTLHAIATLLNKSGKVPTGYAYKNVICLGHILDAQGKKMSKSRGNIIDPMEVMNEYGADMLRWMLFTINQPGLPKCFDIKKMCEVMNRVFRMLWNSYYFFVMYANIDKFSASESRAFGNKNLLDRWIISELNILIKEIDDRLNNYDIYNAAKNIEVFIDDLSNWYIRRSRKRFWKSENDNDKNQAYQTLHYILVELSKLMAPFTPFVAEEIYRNLSLCHSELAEESNKNKELDPSAPLRSAQDDNIYSVHLANFPVADEKLIDEKLNKNMLAIREIVTRGLQLRAESKIKVRQPLAYLKLNPNKFHEVDMYRDRFLIDIVADEVNVKKIVVDPEITEDLILNTEISEELKLEGQAREVIRHIQEMRKEAGYEVDNRVKVCYTGLLGVFDKFGQMIAKETLADGLKSGEMSDADLEKSFEIDGEKIKIQIKR